MVALTLSFEMNGLLSKNGEFVLRGNLKLRLKEMFYKTLHDGVYRAWLVDNMLIAQLYIKQMF